MIHDGGKCLTFHVSCSIFDEFLILGLFGYCVYSTASVGAVCYGDGKSIIDESNDFCIKASNVCITTLTDAQRISLITVWLVILVSVLCIVINRDRIRKRREDRKRKKMGYFPDNEVEETEQYME